MPNRFLFLGRYEGVKGLGELVQAYARYHLEAKEPWPLDCYGTGSLAGLLDRVPGITDHGFVQPSHLGRIFCDYGVLVLPSRFEPWGVAVAEACSAGLPVICTNECGAAVELVRPYYNGLVVPARDVGALASALRWMHDKPAVAQSMGQRSLALAAPYSAECWAHRILEAVAEVLRDRRPTCKR